MNLKFFVFPIVFLLFNSQLVAQDVQEELVLTAKDSIVTSSWIAGVGFNAVDDAGSEFTNFFNVTDNWHIVPFPSRASIGRFFDIGLGIELIATYNKYQEGKTVDGFVNMQESTYYSGDLRFTYDLNKILGETGFFDPYVGLGVGYTEANNQGRGTYNTSIGFRAWLSDAWGLDFSSSGKWTMTPDNSTNHIQHAAGVVYRFSQEKGLSKKGKEKQRQIQQIAEEQQRIQDSINAAQQAEEDARLLAERLQREEAERLAAAENQKQNDEDIRKKSIEDAINALGYVYFDLNSSYLTQDGKILLDNLTQILKENPSVVISVKSHTDSRGSDNYNQWLSERRVMRTADYLISKGISDSRIKVEAFGEQKLANDCANNVPCSEEKHRENRRSEFEILKY